MFPIYAMTMGGGVAAYTPAQQSLTAWYRASYTGSPWAANASNGASGSNGNFTEATNPAISGTALNGLTPASFNGTTRILTGAQNLSTYITTAAWSLSVLVKPASTVVARSVGAGYNDPAIIAETVQGYWYLTYTTSGVTIGHYNSVAGVWKEATQACSSGAWHLVHAWFDGVNISIAVDSVAATSTASTEQFLTGTGAVKMGRNFAAAFAPCDIAEVIIAATNLGATARGNIRSYVNSRYGLIL